MQQISQNNNHQTNKSPKKGYFFLLVSLGVLPIYVFFNPIRWAAFYYNFPATFYLFRPYAVTHHAVDILLIAWLGGLGYIIGKTHLRHWLPCHAPWVALSISFGWAWIALIMFFLAIFQQLSVFSLLIVLIGLTLIYGWIYFRSLPKITLSTKQSIHSFKQSLSAFSVEERFAIFFIVVAIFVALVSSLMPPTQSDGLRYHLTAPKLYLEHGGFYVLPNLAFSNFPFLVEYLFLIPLAFESLCGPKLIHCSYFLFSLMLIFHMGTTLGNRRTGLFAAAIFATTPFIPLFASWSFIEFGLTCYILAGFVICLELFTSAQKEEPTWGKAVLLGLFGGFTVGCKYTALAVLAFFCAAPLLFSLLKKRNFFIAGLSRGFFIGLIGMLVASPWFIKNWILLGNPVYPFAASLFPTPYWSDFNALFFAYHAGLKGNLNAVKQLPFIDQLFDLITLPFRITLFPGNPERHAESFGEWPLGMLWLAMSPLLFFYRHWTFRKAMHVVFAVFLFLIWAYTYRDTRFLIPSLAIAAPLFGLLIHELLASGKWLRWIVLLMVLYGGCELGFRLYIPGTYSPWRVVGGEVKTENYLGFQSDFTRSTYQAFRFLREHTSPNETVLLHAIERPFYCPNKYIGADFFNTDPLIQWSWEYPDPNHLLRHIQSNEIRYLVYFYGKIQNPYYFRLYRLFRLPPEKGIEFLREIHEHEPARVQYPFVYDQWQKEFSQALSKAETESKNIKAIQYILSGEAFEEVFRFDMSPEKPYQGIVIYKIPDSPVTF